MPHRTCLVSFTDIHRVRHTVEVNASSLYEAAVLGLVEFRRSQFTHAAVPTGATLSIKVREPEQTHEVKVDALKMWLESQGRTPRDLVERRKLREMLEGASDG